MLLRIEETDRERSTAAAINAIIDGLTWLGLNWDGEIIFQFSRAARHRQVAEQLLGSGHAYRCYCSHVWSVDKETRELIEHVTPLPNKLPPPLSEGLRRIQ